MTSIKVVLPEEQKKQIKKEAIDEGKTISRFILDLLKDVETGEQKEINEITERLNRFGGQLSKEERKRLKQRKRELQERI